MTDAQQWQVKPLRKARVEKSSAKDRVDELSRTLQQHPVHGCNVQVTLLPPGGIATIMVKKEDA